MAPASDLIVNHTDAIDVVKSNTGVFYTTNVSMEDTACPMASHF
jgi:hypothetical protein